MKSLFFILLLSLSVISEGKFVNDWSKVDSRSEYVKSDNIVIDDTDFKEIEGSISGGTEVVPNSYPFVVHLRAQSVTDKECQGSLITLRTVLTEAYCLVGSFRTLIMAGRHYLEETSSTHQGLMALSDQYRIHPNYQGNEFNIATLLISTPFFETNAVRPVALPWGSEESFVGEQAWITGDK